MTSKSILAFFATLLLVGSLAAAASPSAASKSDTPAQASSAPPLAWSPSCLGNRSVSEVPELFAPQKATVFPCGPCSVDECQGKNLGDSCPGGLNFTCVLGGFCGSGPGSPKYCKCQDNTP